MAHKKGLGSSRNGRDSNAQRLGVKVFAGQTVTGGEIIVRQRGTVFKPGEGVGIGRDHTIYARAEGTVQFTRGRAGRVISIVGDESDGGGVAVAETPASAPVAETPEQAPEPSTADADEVETADRTAAGTDPVDETGEDTESSPASAE